jgi:DMSO/TMAO reductase YedYZ heme-binding membrane subunit
MRLSGRAFSILFAVAGLAILVVTDQVVPPATPYQAQMRDWLAARATGITVLVLLAIMVVLGLALSHPDQAQWKQAKRIYPWHETLWVFVIAFLAVHVAAIVLDPYANVDIVGALLPGLSKYRTVPVALGSLGLYATLITGATARWTRLLPSGIWLKLHRFAAVALGLGWIHGALSGTDTGALRLVYWGIAVVVVAAAVYRYWIVRRRAERRAQSPQHPGRMPLPMPLPMPVPARDLMEESDVRSHPAT